MFEGRRGRRPPLPATYVAKVTLIEGTEGAPITASDDEQVLRAHVDEERAEASGKGVVYVIYLLIICINYNQKCRM
jgi:hypothetical protein